MATHLTARLLSACWSASYYSAPLLGTGRNTTIVNSMNVRGTEMRGLVCAYARPCAGWLICGSFPRWGTATESFRDAEEGPVVCSSTWRVDSWRTLRFIRELHAAIWRTRTYDSRGARRQVTRVIYHITKKRNPATRRSCVMFNGLFNIEDGISLNAHLLVSWR